MRKRRYVVAACVAMMMSVSLAACADKEENSGIYTLEAKEIVTASRNEEKDKGSQQPEFPDDVAPEEDLDTGREDVGQAESDNAGNTVNASEETAVPDETNIVSPESTEASVVNQQTQNISAPSATIVGSVKSLGDGSFSISRANIDGNIMVSTDETVNVVYSDSTEFEVCTSTDGGVTASFAAGTSADLQKGRIVDIEGAYESSDFVAQKITIRIFG